MPGLQIEGITSKGQLVPLLFTHEAVAASLTDSQLLIIDLVGLSSAAQANDEYVMPWAGEVVGIGWTLSAAATAGTLTIGATLAGTEDADTTITITTGQRGTLQVPRGKMVFAKDGRLGCEITTDGSWNGTTADLAVVLYVLLDLDGI